MDDVPQRRMDVEAHAKGSTPTARLADQALRYACREIGLMEGVLRPWVDPLAVERLRDMVYSVLTTIAALASQGKVHPMPRLRLGPEDPPGSRVRRRLRLGVFPISANPLHWMHLGAGLMAIARLHLDSVVYIIAGDDPRKPGLLRAEVRHAIAQEMLRPFAPFFRYSPIAIGSDLPGEENLFRLLSMNPDQPIDAHYLAGSDHYQRLCPTSGEPDTIQRLEDGVRKRIYGYRPGVHSVSAAFLDRGIPTRPVKTFLDVTWIQDIPMKCSSTGIRKALGGQGPPAELLGLPYSVFCHIRSLGLYRPHPLEGVRNPREVGDTRATPFHTMPLRAAASRAAASAEATSAEARDQERAFLESLQS